MSLFITKHLTKTIPIENDDPRRGCSILEFALEDAVHQVPQRFMHQVLNLGISIRCEDRTSTDKGGLWISC